MTRSLVLNSASDRARRVKTTWQNAHRDHVSPQDRQSSGRDTRRVFRTFASLFMPRGRAAVKLSSRRAKDPTGTRSAGARKHLRPLSTRVPRSLRPVHSPLTEEAPSRTRRRSSPGDRPPNRDPRRTIWHSRSPPVCSRCSRSFERPLHFFMSADRAIRSSWGRIPSPPRCAEYRRLVPSPRCRA